MKSIITGLFLITTIFTCSNKTINSQIKEDFRMDKFQFESIDDNVLVQTIFDYISENVIKEDYVNEYKNIKNLSEGMQYVWAIWWLEAEVNNGGFNQYFYNTSGQFAEEAYKGCLAIGANKTAEIVNSAVLTIFQEMDLYKKTKEAGTIEAFMDSYKETKLGQFDDEFYKYEDDISGLLTKYIRNNPEMFVRN